MPCHRASGLAIGLRQSQGQVLVLALPQLCQEALVQSCTVRCLYIVQTQQCAMLLLISSTLQPGYSALSAVPYFAATRRIAAGSQDGKGPSTSQCSSVGRTPWLPSPGCRGKTILNGKLAKEQKVKSVVPVQCNNSANFAVAQHDATANCLWANSWQ